MVDGIESDIYIHRYTLRRIGSATNTLGERQYIEQHIHMWEQSEFPSGDQVGRVVIVVFYTTYTFTLCDITSQRYNKRAEHRQHTTTICKRIHYIRRKCARNLFVGWFFFPSFAMYVSLMFLMLFMLWCDTTQVGLPRLRSTYTNRTELRTWNNKNNVACNGAFWRCAVNGPEAQSFEFTIFTDGNFPSLTLRVFSIVDFLSLSH